MKAAAPLKYQWLDRLQEVDRQYRLTVRAVRGYWISGRDGTVVLPPDAALRNVSHLLGSQPPEVDAGGVLERTFLIRLFAVFEEACRRCRIERYQRTLEDQIGCRQLLTWLPRQAGCWITQTMHRLADEVRDYRNDLIHLNREHAPVRFADARGRLGGYLKGLPEDWR